MQLGVTCGLCSRYPFNLTASFDDRLSTSGTPVFMPNRSVGSYWCTTSPAAFGCIYRPRRDAVSKPGVNHLDIEVEREALSGLYQRVELRDVGVQFDLDCGSSAKGGLNRETRPDVCPLHSSDGAPAVPTFCSRSSRRKKIMYILATANFSPWKIFPLTLKNSRTEPWRTTRGLITTTMQRRR